MEYHKTAISAVEAAGVNPWESALPAMSVRKLEPGDEMSLTPYGSVIRLTGKDIDYAA